MIDLSLLHSHHRRYHHYHPAHRRQAGLHLHDQTRATETIPHIHVNAPKDCSEPKSMYQAFLCISVLKKKHDAPGVSAHQDRCTRSYPQKPRFSMHQIQFGALIFMLSQQRKINALRCFCAISERLVHPKNQRTWCQKISKVQKINAPDPVLVHRFWSPDVPRCSDFGMG